MEPGPRLLVRTAAVLVRLANLTLAVAERILFPVATRSPKRIGVLRVGMVGDVLVALPAVRALRARYPSAKLIWLTSPGPQGAPGWTELAERNESDEQLIWHTTDLESKAGRRSLLVRLRLARLDRVFVLPQDRTTFTSELRRLVALRLAGVRGVRGVRIAVASGLPWPLGKLLGRAFDRGVPGPREADRLLLGVGASPPSRPPIRGRDDVGRAPQVAARLDSLLREGHGPWLAISPGAKLAKKRWPAESFVEIARRWIDRGGRIVLLGAPGERALADSIAEEARRDRDPAAVLQLAGELDLRGSAEVLRRCSLALANDSGAMHLAAELGIPGAGLFSGMDRPGVWDPVLGSIRALRGSAPCAPCFERACLLDRACLREIGVETVWQALLGAAQSLPTPLAQDRDGPPAALPGATAPAPSGR